MFQRSAAYALIGIRELYNRYNLHNLYGFVLNNLYRIDLYDWNTDFDLNNIFGLCYTTMFERPPTFRYTSSVTLKKCNCWSQLHECGRLFCKGRSWDNPWSHAWISNRKFLCTKTSFSKCCLGLVFWLLVFAFFFWFVGM